jgi:CHAT domain-containing protein
MVDLLGGKTVSKKRYLSRMDKEREVLLARADELKDQINSERALDKTNSVASLQRSLVLVENKVDRLKENVASCSQELKSFSLINSLTADEARALAGDDATLVEYWASSGGRVELAAVVTKDRIYLRHLPPYEQGIVARFREALIADAESVRGLDIVASGEEGRTQDTSENQLFERLVLPIAESEDDRLALSTQSEAMALAQEAYDVFVRPLEDVLKTETVYFLPDGNLNLLPFQALHDGDAYLVEKHSVAYAPSATVLSFCRAKRKPAGGSMLAFGNPNLQNARYKLAHAEKEVRTIGSMFKEAKILVGSDANEKAFQLLAEDYDVLHFACHGVIDQNHPMRSCLRLAQDRDNDGFLHAREIFDVDLRAGLVTLSACDSGLGTITLGSEVLGLTRAMMFAGTPSVVSSLWKVDDEATAELMVDFYRGLSTESKAAALRKAQINMIHEGTPAYYWAPFCLHGDHM